MKGLPAYPVALAAALDVAAGPGSTHARSPAEAVGDVLAEDLRADRDLPPFDRAQMDGYAVRSGDLGVVEAWPVAAVVPAGGVATTPVPPQACVKIATGAPVPPELDAVIPHEESDRNDPVRFRVDSVTPGRAIHPRGADARAGDVVCPAGTIVGPPHVALAAAVGVSTLTVRRRPRVTVLTSGDEVVGPDDPVAAHQIRNSNGPMLLTLLARVGAEPMTNVHVRDEGSETNDAVQRALAASDLVITVGGVSAGERDHFPDAFAAAGVTMVVRGAAIQPGKPVMVGRVGGDGAIVVALPGNPVSALACACLFAWPIVRRWSGADPRLPWLATRLAAPVKPNPRRTAFRPTRIEPDGRVTVPAWAGSGDLTHTAGTHGLVELPMQDAEVTPGTPVRFLPWP
ncbi:MAG: molybdopterin molybdotransferase MoeA [Phycisphaerae bacterium]|nr:molybdopterin molybdotransferase MoeA [Phycisphaerae bacterium]